MDVLIQVWDYLPPFIKGDLPSWLAVIGAVIAMLFVLRKPSAHTELRMIRLHFDSNGGPISLELDLTTYSHAPNLSARAKLKLDRVEFAMRPEPVEAPQNYRYATVNTFHLRFLGQYTKHQVSPKMAFVDVKVRFSDGSRARLREKTSLVLGEDSS